MSALARIKKTAAQHEHERQYDKALALYARLLDGAGAGEEEVDVALFNRAGDLALRVGDAARAVGYFERALDLYAAAGLLNNAVALGVKILRHAPHHLSAHYTLGVLYGRKGFAGDARHHLLTYAVQMQRAGRVDETSRVLAEVAGTCGDVTDLRGAYDAYSALGGDPAYAAPLTSAGAGDAPPAPRPTTTAEPEYLDLSVGTAAGAGAGEAAAVAPPGAGRAAEPPAFDAPDLDILELDMPAVDSPAVGSRPDSAPASGRAAGLAPAFDPADFGLDASDAAPCGVAAFDATAFGGDGAGDDVPAFDGLNFLMTDVPADDAFGLTPAESGAVAPADGDAFGAAGVHPAAAAGDAPGALVFLDVSDDESDDDALEDERAPLTPAAHRADGGRLAALANDPPPLRLADLADVGRPRAAAPPALRSDELAAAAGDADGRFADLLAVELGDAAALAAAGSAPPAGAPAVAPFADREAPAAPAGPARSDAPADVRPSAPFADADEGLDLGAWLRDTTPEESTRMTTADVPQSGDEQADFDATLRVFTAGVTRAVGHEDFDSHYDLGVAFREMGLVEEAIVQFQRAAQAPGRPLRALEALGQCFLDAGQPELTLSTLAGPVTAADPGAGDASLVAVHYLMGAAAQALGRPDDARRWLVRVVATDVRFRDASRRLAALPPPTPTR